MLNNQHVTRQLGYTQGQPMGGPKVNKLIGKLMSIVCIAKQLYFSYKSQTFFYNRNSFWNIFFFGIACSASVTLPTLTSDISCHLDDTCTGLQCCVASSQLKRSYEVYFSIDHCTSSLSIQIEKVFYNRTLVGFPWGETPLDKLPVYYKTHIFSSWYIYFI